MSKRYRDALLYVGALTLWLPCNMLLNKVTAEDTGNVGVFVRNSISVAHDFIVMVTRYGHLDCIGRPAPSDHRFKLVRNGSFYELAGYTFVYDYMRDGSHYWSFSDFESRVITKTGKIMQIGDVFVSYCIDNSIIIVR